MGEKRKKNKDQGSGRKRAAGRHRRVPGQNMLTQEQKEMENRRVSRVSHSCTLYIMRDES